jgi:hypothetical protein
MPRDQRLYMTFPIDFWKHEKVRRLSDAAFRAFIESNGYSRERESDGVIEAADAEFLWSVDALGELTRSHPTRPLMVRQEADYVLRDYAEHQFTKADRDELSRKRREAGRKGGQASAKQVLSKSEQTEAGRERGIGISTPNGVEGKPLSPFCRYHPDGTDTPCKGCANARLSFEVKKTAEKNKPTPAVRRAPECAMHPGYPLPCDRCKVDA